MLFQHLDPDPENRILKTDPDPATLKSPDPQPLPCSSVADPGSGAFLTPWIWDPGCVKSQDPNPG
jgi:hypothetical protein